jgi:hypothetical protein
VEAALAIATLVGVVVLCAAGITAAALQIRCVDAAREAARLAARGDVAAAAIGLVPSGASLEVRREGGYVLARVSSRAPLLPGLVLAGEAVAAAEPDR